MNITYCAITNRGRIRGNNEDNFMAAGKSPERQSFSDSEYIQKGTIKAGKKGNLFCVCDGMGGMNAGETASEFIISAIKERQAYIDSMGFEESVTFLNGYLSEQNEKLYALSKSSVDMDGMGTTFVGLNINGEKAVALNVGDSRCYFLRKGGLYQLTTDHSEAERLVRMGVMKRESVRGSRERSMLYRYLGTPPEAGKLECAVSQAVQLKKDDMFLLCSDGLTDMVEDIVIAGILNNSRSPEQAARTLIDKALENGGKDNVTVIVLGVSSAGIKQKLLIAAGIIILLTLITFLVLSLFNRDGAGINANPQLPAPSHIKSMTPK